eukprot:980358_1
MGCCFGHDGQENDEVLQNLEAGSVVDVSEREEVDQSAAKSLQPSFRTRFMYVVSGVVGLLVVAALVYMGYNHFHAQQKVDGGVSPWKPIVTADRMVGATSPGAHMVTLVDAHSAEALKKANVDADTCGKLETMEYTTQVVAGFSYRVHAKCSKRPDIEIEIKFWKRIWMPEPE